jgi:hypothetical protein
LIPSVAELTDRPLTTNSPIDSWWFGTDDQSSLLIAINDNLLGAFATTSKAQTTASIDNLLSVFEPIDNLEGRVQESDAKPANDPNHPPQITSKSNQQFLGGRCALRLLRHGSYIIFQSGYNFHQLTYTLLLHTGQTPCFRLDRTAIPHD